AARRLVGGPLVVLVSPAALAALGDDDAVAGAEVGEEFRGLGVVHQRAGGHADDLVEAGRAGHLAPAAGLAILGGPVVLAAEVVERVDVLIRVEDDRAASSAGAAVGASRGAALLASEGGA